MCKCDLHVKLSNLSLKNPVMPASGTCDYLEDNAELYNIKNLGAVVLKTVQRYPCAGNKLPRIVEARAGIINAVGIPSNGIERFIAEELPLYKDFPTPVIVSLAGEQVVDYLECAEMIAPCHSVAAVELNLSCPNIGTGLTFSSNEELIRQIVSGVRKRINIPIIVKMAPELSRITYFSQCIEDSGADAITIANTFMSMAIDIEQQRPILGNIFGGLSGPAIKPIVLAMVFKAYKHVHIPIIASGGISCCQDAIEYLLAGASALQIGCANFANPLVMSEVVAGIEDYMISHGCHTLQEIIGAAHN